MKRFGVILIIVLVALCGFGALALRKFKPGSALASADAGTVTVQLGDLDVTVVETGTLNAQNVVELKSLVGGRVEKLTVEEGDHVKKGQLIAIIDPRETQLLVDQSTAQVLGAKNQAERSQIELAQRRQTILADLASANARLLQAEQEFKAQPELTRTAIDQAKANLETAKKEKERLKNSSEPNQQVAAQNSINEAEANLANAEAEFSRDKELLAKGFISQKQMEDDQLQVDLQKTRLQSAKGNLDTLETGFVAELAKADQSIAQAQAGVDSAVANSIQDKIKRQAYLSAIADRNKAEVARRDVEALGKGVAQNWATVAQYKSALGDGMRNLSETTIRAPFDGIVTKKEIRVGELVAALGSFSSGTPIIRVEDRRSMKVQLDVNEIDTARMTLGMVTQVSVDALPDKTFVGHITKIAPSSTAMDTSSSTTTTASTTDAVVKYSVEVRIDNPGNEVRSGMSAKCSFKVVHHPNVLMAPLEYVGHDAQGPFISVAQAPKPGGSPSQPGSDAPTGDKKPVKTGTQNGTMVELVSGAEEGEKLVKPKFDGPPRKGAMQGGPDS